MTRRVKTFYWIAGGLIVALILGAAFFDWNMVKPYAERQLSESSGRTVSLAGNLGVHLALAPRVHVEHVRIANPPWAREKEMLDADAVDITIDLARLLEGEYYLSDVVLTHPKLDLEISPDGRHNWYLDPEQKDEKSALHVGRLQVDAGDVTFHDPGKQTEIRARISTQNSAQGEVNVVFAASGKLNGLPLQASGKGGSVMALRDERAPYPIKFHAALGQTQADADGTVTGLTALKAADIQLALRGRNFADLYPLLKVTLPPTPPYRISGYLRHDSKRLEYDQFHGQMGASDLAGKVAVDLSGKTPSVKADVTSNTLDVLDLGPLIGAHPKAPAPQTDDRVLPDESFNVERWSSIDMDVRLKGKHLLHAAQMPLDNLTAHFIMRDGKLTVDPLNFGAVGGELASKVVLDGRRQPLQGQVTARVRKLKLSRIAPAVKLPGATVGDISGDVNLSGRGNSVASMLATADGKVGFAITDGEVSKLMLKLVGLDFGGYLITKLKGDREVPIRCAIASFDAKQGVLETDAFVFDTADENVVGSGTIDLRDEALALTIKPQPKTKSILSLRSPIYVNGTLRHPAVGLNKGALAARLGSAVGLGILNPAAALVPLIETGPGKDSDCGQLLASLGEQNKRMPAARSGARGAATRAQK